MKNPKGSWSGVSLQAMAHAEYLQAASVAYISETFAVETDEVDLRVMTRESFFKAMEVAEKNGTTEQFEERLASQLMPIIQAVMAPPTEGADGSNSRPA